MPDDIKNLSFEEALSELENIIRKMEMGDVKLSESVLFYERGMALKNHCEKILKDAQLKIEKIQLTPIGDNEVKVETSPFEV